jgi:hypothetical protein
MFPLFLLLTTFTLCLRPTVLSLIRIFTSKEEKGCPATWVCVLWLLVPGTVRLLSLPLVLYDLLSFPHQLLTLQPFNWLLIKLSPIVVTNVVYRHVAE